MFGLATQSDLDVLDQFFNQYIDYTKGKTNKFNFNMQSGNTNVNNLLEKWQRKAKETEIDVQADMKIIGEVVLTMDKVEQGVYGCRIHANTTNPMLNTLKQTINKMLENLDNDIKQLKTVVESYTSDDFRNKININPNLKADMLAVMESVNLLGDSLSNSAKSNLENGKHLEENSATMKESVNNLADKANQQAASLEETAAAVEEITSITRNNANNTTKMSELGKKVQDAVSKGMTLASQT